MDSSVRTTPASAESNDHYNPKLQQLAYQLRQTMTKAEACLWKYTLRAGGLGGYSFRRQRPILNYIADFVCFELRLVIEVDGLTHTFEDSQAKDTAKDADLRAIGFEVVRFRDEDVLEDMTGVQRYLFNWVEEWEKNRELLGKEEQ